MFKYKTKGNVSPQGKRRVYFTCHPEDYERFFEQISAELLNITECAVWYSTDDGYEDIDTDLGQMNLIVVPVTTKLLTKPCRARDTDVPFALKNHIPILPLMQEGGLDELYSRHFGDLHYLDPNARNDSALSYEEKLKKYLNSVLVGDEMAAKVRAAFDAYIFLSYRKKDRKYANELMRLIHKNDFCRDIAIWYDEYLTPGENFNDAISDALKKSDLFTMVVTPNLVNEKNYVESVEYPEAMKQKKPILPVELEKTNHDALSKHYRGIPNSVDARDETVLSEALEAALSCIARRENDSDPQHNFFIGLAYLDGIDVEVNHERALSLITFAAESKENRVPEAIEKLVSMYSEGHGVERDYRTAAEWQRNLVEYWEAEYWKSHGIGNCKSLLFALHNFGDQLYDLKDLDAAEDAYKRLLTLCEHLTTESGTVYIRENLLISYGGLGRIHTDQGDMDGAEEYYRKGLVLSKQLAEETKTIVSWRNLSTNYERLGDLCKARGNLDGAMEFYQKAILLREQLTEESGTVDAHVWHGLDITYNNFGSICKERGDLDGARKFYHKALILSEQLVEETETMDAWHRLVVCYNNLGNLCVAQGDLDGAEKFFRKALALSKQLVENTETMDAWRSLSGCYNNLGNLCVAQGNLDNAENFFRKDLALCKQLAEKTKTVDARRCLTANYNNLGNLCAEWGDLDRAGEFYQKALFLSKQLAGETETVEARRDLSGVYINIGDFCVNRDDP